MVTAARTGRQTGRQPYGGSALRVSKLYLWVKFPHYMLSSLRILWPVAFRSVLFKCSSLSSTVLFVINGAFDARVLGGL